jgi:predicted CopG family antitoxin
MAQRRSGVQKAGISAALDLNKSSNYNIYMAHTLTITVDDTVYETLKPFVEQQTLNAFLSKVIGKDSSSTQITHTNIADFRGSLHKVDTSDIREENDRDI